MSNPDEELDLVQLCRSAGGRKDGGGTRRSAGCSRRRSRRDASGSRSGERTHVPGARASAESADRSDFQQLCVGFLASLAPHAVATSVPVRRFKYKVNAAGFWRGENARSKDVVKTAVVVLFDQVDNCFCECVDQQALLGESTRCAAKRSGSKPKSGRTSRSSPRPTISSANCGAGIMRRAGIRHTASSAPGSKNSSTRCIRAAASNASAGPGPPISVIWPFRPDSSRRMKSKPAGESSI